MTPLERVLVAAARRFWRVYTRIAFTTSTRVGAESFRVAVGDGMGLPLLHFSDKERAYTGLLRAVLAGRGGTVVDVGVNVGRWMLLIAEVDRQQPYVGFEVHASCAAYVNRLIRLNDLRHHVIVPIGLGARLSVAMLRTAGDSDVSASTIEGHYPKMQFSRALPVLLEQGDAVLPQLGVQRVALIKIDVEGGELEVIQGLAETIERDKPPLIVEVAPYQHWIVRGETELAAFRKGRVLQLEGLLKKHGYIFARITNGGTAVPVDTLEPGMSTDTDEMDYLCVPVP